MKKITFLMAFLTVLSWQGISQVINEGFEGAFPPTNWTLDTVSGAATWVSNTGNNNGSVPSAHTGTLNAMFYSGNYNGDITKLITPSMDLSVLPAYDLNFWYTQNDWGGDQDTLTIYYKTSTAGSWVYLASYTSSVSTWTPVTISLPNLSNDYYIAFEGYSGYGYGVTVDDVVVDAPPSCPDPSMLTVINLTSTSADLGWTDNAGASMWDIEWDTTGFTQGTGNMVIGTTTNPHNVSGLTANTYYDFYVRADCGGSGTSNWVGPFTFYTGYCIPAPSSVDGNGITNVTMGSINNTTGTEAGNYGDYSAMVTNAVQGANLGIDITLETGYTYDLWVWVDWNDDLDFTDPGEEFFLGTSTANNPTTFNGSILVPSGATLGNHRIRIGGADAGLGTTSPSDPCYTGTWGAFEDYTLNVVAPSPNDLGVISISSTPTGCGLGMESVTVEILNFGTVAQTGFDVVYSLNGSPIAPETVSSNINPGDTLTYMFTTLANMSIPGQFTIDSWTDLTGDGDNTNDTTSGWMNEHLPNSLMYSGNAPISTTIAEGTTTSICTNGLVNNMLDGCFSLSALVIDSLEHTYTGDLDIYLISPAGDTLEVSTDNNGTFDDMMNVTFTDTASTYITGVDPTHGGYFHVEDSLGFSKFDGTNPEGEWKLWISDDAGGDDGAIYYWHLEFTDNSFAVNLGGDTTSCDSITITLDAGVSGNHSYLWSTGETTQQIMVDTNSLGGSGTHNIYVTVTDSITGCAITDSVIITYTTCTGINDIVNNVSANILPNPNKGLFTLNINANNIEQLNVEVVNIQGQTVYSKNNFDNMNKVSEQIDLSSNSKGLYFVIITTEKSIKTEKLIIQ